MVLQVTVVSDAVYKLLYMLVKQCDGRGEEGHRSQVSRSDMILINKVYSCSLVVQTLSNT